MSFTVILLVVASTVPLVLSALILTVKLSAPSVTWSASGPTVKLPALLVIVKLPLLVLKSPLLVVLWFIDQYNVILLLTLVVATFIVTLPPSFTLLAAGVAVYVALFILTVFDCANSFVKASLSACV